MIAKIASNCNQTINNPNITFSVKNLVFSVGPSIMNYKIFVAVFNTKSATMNINFLY